MHHLSLSGKVNRGQQFDQSNELRSFYDPRDCDSGLDINSNSPSPPGHRSSQGKTPGADRSIVDLDEIVEKYVQFMWTQTKSKSDKKYEIEDMDIVVNWNKVTVTQDEACFEPKPISMQKPLNQTLFKTYFTNKSDQIQEYSFKTERSTRQSCEFMFTKAFTREKNAGVSFKIPGDIMEIGGGIRGEQTVECGKDQVNEEEVKWGCDSIIKVGPFSKTSACLVITEVQMEKQFCLQTYMRGRLTIVLNHKKDGFVKSFSADMSQVIGLADEKQWMPRNSTKFEVVTINNEKIVKSSLYGRCKFRLGVEQQIEINEEKL